MQESSLLEKFYKPLDLDMARFTRQFILSKDSDVIPQGWDRYEMEHWHLGVSELPVIDIENFAGENIGWCIGYPIHLKTPWTSKIVIDCHHNELINMDDVEKLYNDTGGRFILVLLTQKQGKFFLDPAGSLSAIYSTSEQTVASTPTLLGDKYEWEEELITALEMPESERWFPSGLTPKKGIRRILPNHYLDLNDWCVVRHWPPSISDLAVEDNINKNVSEITSCIKETIGIIAERYPIQLTITAGKDSRMVLACARDYLSKISLFTQSGDQETIDTHIASKLTQKLGLQHSLLPVKTATDEEILYWLYMTGHAIGGEIMNIHKTVEGYDRQSVVLNGVFGEVARAVYWKEEDTVATKITAKELLKRRDIPIEDRILSETEKWISELSDYNAFEVLDLFFLEQGEGCGESPKFYTNIYSKFGISPFNHRRVFHAIMKMPYKYRLSHQLPNDICQKLWPELLELPFNQYTGFKILTSKSKNTVNNTKHYAKRIAKKLLKRNA
jgi:hypothetical protein